MGRRVQLSEFRRKKRQPSRLNDVLLARYVQACQILFAKSEFEHT